MGTKVHVKPLANCDGYCAQANGCRVGGFQCSECGSWFCPDTDGGDFINGTKYVCRSCADAMAED